MKSYKSKMIVSKRIWYKSKKHPNKYYAIKPVGGEKITIKELRDKLNLIFGIQSSKDDRAYIIEGHDF